MKKVLIFIFILIVISIVACQKAVKKEEIVEKKVEVPKVETTGDAAVDAVGNDLNTVNNVEKDLSVDELSDLDSGLADIQNI